MRAENIAILMLIFHFHNFYTQYCYLHVSDPSDDYYSTHWFAPEKFKQMRRLKKSIFGRLQPR